MPRLSLQCRAWVAVVFASYCVAVTGCGSGEYRRLMADRVDKVRTGASFRMLFGPSQIPGTTIKIRVPMAFPKSYVAESAHPHDGPKVNPERIQPPFLALPGFKICYEGTGQDPQVGKVPFYCYLAAVPGTAADADKLAAELQAKLKETFKDAPEAWDVVDAPTPDGKGLQWRKIRVVGEQPFLLRSPDKKVAAKNLPGIFELWMHATADFIVLVGWRAPASVDGPTPEAETAALVTAGITGADTKPDLSAMPIRTAGTLSVEAAPAADGAN